MSFALRIVDPARRDMREAWLWYSEIRLELAAEFMHYAYEALESASHNPVSYRVVYKDMRRVRVDRFPYAAFFTIRENAVRVLAVMHTRRKPQLWQSRFLEHG